MTCKLTQLGQLNDVQSELIDDSRSRCERVDNSTSIKM